MLRSGAARRIALEWKNGVLVEVRMARRGVTLLELLVVLVLISISALLVIPSLRMPNSLNVTDGTDGRAPSAVDVVMTTARRVAIKRGEPVRLRVASDGVWAIVPAKGGEAIQGGRISESLSWVPDVTIDATGVCVLNDGATPRANARAWDAIGCHWLEAKS
ncbi:MAG: prepilin-type N-terminal cleavage/methylation domain-containing protein [Gemmatimonadaceae bacterium]